MGKTPPRGEKSFWNNNYNWVSISDMIDGKIIKQTKEMVSQKAYDNIFNGEISPKGTLLMSFKLTIGKVSILDMNSFHNEAIISIYPYLDNKNIIRDYLFKVLPLISNHGNTKNAIKGKTLNSKSIDNLLIPITNLNEINKITNKIISLEPIIERYNNKFFELERLNNTYKEELKKSILQYAIQGKLVKQDPNDESAEVLINKILAEKRELIKTKQIKKENLSIIYKDSTDNQFYEKFDDGTINNITDEIPFDIPNNWSWVRFNNIMDVRDGTHDSPNYHVSGIPLVTSKNLSEKGLDFENVKYISLEDSEKINIRSRVDDGDILFAMIGSIGNPVIVKKEFEFSIKNIALFKNTYNININYVFMVLKFMQVKMKKDASGGVQKFVSLNYLRNFLIPFPPEKEQKRLINKLNSITEIIETAE